MNLTTICLLLVQSNDNKKCRPMACNELQLEATGDIHGIYKPLGMRLLERVKGDQSLIMRLCSLKETLILITFSDCFVRGFRELHWKCKTVKNVAQPVIVAYGEGKKIKK